jgi:hypothetical protein
MSWVKKVLVTLILTVGILSVMAPATALAATCTQKDDNFLGFPTWYKYLQLESDCSITVDFEGDPAVLGKILLAVFEIMLRVGGIAAVIFVLYGSIQYLISQGEPENLKNARTTIMNALIGLIITMFATGIVNLIGGRIT